MSIYDGNDIISQPPPIQYHEFKCYQCGFNNRFVKPPSFIDWKKEALIYKEMRNNIIHELNELMSFSDLHYGMNPHKDKLIEELTKIRDKYSK